MEHFISGSAANERKVLMSEFVSLKQISEELGIPMKTVYFYRNKGLFPTYKFGKHYRVSVRDFEDFKARALLDVLYLMETGL